jgi:hypothetical protein
MSFEFHPCKLEMDYEAYMKYLLQHHDELNLPYSFATKLSFIGGPLIFGKAMLVIHEETFEFVGAASFVYGTGANQYEDRHICQIEVAFIQKDCRRTSLFVQGMQAMVDLIKEDNPSVTQIQFWASADHEELNHLFAKFSALPGSTRSIVNGLALYTVPFQQFETYCLRLSSRFIET